MKERGEKRGDLAKEIFFLRRKKEEEEKIGCRILIGVFVANLNFSSGIVDVKLFCSGLFKS